MKTKISAVSALEILDSRGNPTVWAEVTLAGGARGSAGVPSGASTGAHEAHEHRDCETSRYHGKGVRRAVERICGPISQALCGRDAADQTGLDARLIELDGTPDKSALGANTILAVSLAAARAAAAAAGEPLWLYLSPEEEKQLPVPMMNILNGGAHAANGVDIQEFMIVPSGIPDFAEQLRAGVQIYHTLGALLEEKGLRCGVGDEGGFAPMLESDEQALDLIVEAIRRAGYFEREIRLALDAAASGWKCEEGYRQSKSGRFFEPGELIAYWERLAEAYPLFSLEDGMGEDDWSGWQRLSRTLGNRLQLVGDDLFVTSCARIREGIGLGAANAVLIKPNQIGTLSETLDAIRIARKAGWGVILSHRSGETEDSFLSDLAVASGCGQIKAGAPCRGERTAKYNRLLMIDAEQRRLH